MRPKLFETLDENNNTTVDRMSIRLHDSTIVFVGVIIRVKHDAVHFLTTSIMIEHFNG